MVKRLPPSSALPTCLRQKEQVRIGTLHASRAAEITSDADQLCIPWLAETPRIRPGHPSVFKLPKWLEIRMRPTTRQSDIDQCPFADEPARAEDNTFTKGTTLLGSVPLDGITRNCEHPLVEWLIRSSGRIIKAAHPPLIGTERAVRVGSQPSSSCQSEYLTKATARYPAELTWQLLGLLIIGA